MKIKLNNIKNNPKIHFKKKLYSKQISKIGMDRFSILDKYERRYKNSFIKNIIPDLKKFIMDSNLHKDTSFKECIGHGGLLSIIFDIGNNKVLKCSLENPLEFRKHNKNFDIPFLSPIKNVNKTFFVIEPKANTNNIDSEDVKEVISKIKSAGLEISKDINEYRTDQVGKYKGKTYLLDTRCAIPKPNRFSRFVYNFCKNHRQVIVVNKIDLKTELENINKHGIKYLHTDETPRKNLSLQEGFKMIWNVIKENIKYTKHTL